MRSSDPIQFDLTLSRSGLQRYGVAAITVAVASLCRFLISPIISTEAPFLLFFAAVMAAGWYGGFRPGLVATILCGVVASIFFMEPPGTFDGDSTTWGLLRIGIFLFEGIITSALCGQLHAARQRAERSAAESRELERTVEQISEAEQRRIGQDLHDGLGQHLTGVAFLSKALQQRLISEHRPESIEAATINQLVNESIRWTRDLARGLAPMDLDQTSLPESLRELARKTSRMFSVECTYEGVESVHLPNDEMALNLYRVAQEAVSNGVKHGSAHHVTIDLEITRGLTLTIHDDGVGFDPACLPPARDGKGMGLLVMRYRAGVIGGNLEILPAAGGGTLIRCHVKPEKARLSEVDPALAKPIWPAEESARASIGVPVRQSPQETPV